MTYYSSEESDDYEIKIREMDFLFPNLPFSSDPDDYERLDEVLVNQNTAILYHKYNCRCFPENYNIKILLINGNGKNITRRDFYKNCNDKWNDYETCDHHFLEYIKVKNNLQISLEFGS